MRYLSDFWHFLRATPVAANLLAALTLALWIIKAVYLDHLPEAFESASDIGRVFEGIMSAIIAGWIFYLFFALLPDWRQKSYLAPFVLRSTAMLAGDARAILDEIEKATGDELSFSRATEAEIVTSFTKVLFSSPTTMIVDLQGTPATWLQFFRSRRERSKKQIRELKQQSRYVEPEVTALILRLDGNSFFSVAEMMEMYPVKNKQLSSLAPGFYRYLVDCRTLIEWRDRHLVPPEVAVLPSLDQ